MTYVSKETRYCVLCTTEITEVQGRPVQGKQISPLPQEHTKALFTAGSHIALNHLVQGPTPYDHTTIMAYAIEYTTGITTTGVHIP